MKAFEDKIAIVTGAASGIGRALSRQLVDDGAHVYVTDVNEPGAQAVAGELGERATAMAVDVTEPAAVQAVVDRAVREHTRLDYMFNNAGFAVGGEVFDMELEHWNRIFDVNVRGVIHGVHAAYPVMVRQRSGHIVNTASIAGLIPCPGLTAYSATKHAVVGLSRGLRGEAHAHGVKVSVVCPGFLDTGIFRNAIHLKIDGEAAKAEVARLLGNPEQAVKVALRGVARNRETIVVTGHARTAYGMQRFVPGLMGRFARQLIERNRKHKRDEIAPVGHDESRDTTKNNNRSGRRP